MSDYIILPRTWLDSAITDHDDYLKAVVYLAKEINDHGKVEFSSGDAKMMFSMSPRRYRTFMQIITSDKQTDKQTTNKTTNITFDFQVVASTKRQTKRQTSDKQKPTKFIPPTEEEVAQYVAEKGYHFNPEQFIPYYEKQEWKQNNGLPIKDWKAACRYWETRWKEKHGEQFYYEIQRQSADRTITRQTSRYSGLEKAAEAVIRRDANIYPTYDD